MDIAMPSPQSGALFARSKLFPGVLTDRLEKPVAGGSVALFRDGHGLIYDARQQVQNRPILNALAAADLLGRLECPSARENGEAAEQCFLLRAKQVVTPVGEGAKSLLAWQRGSAAARQETKTVVQPPGNLAHRQRLDPS